MCVRVCACVSERETFCVLIVEGILVSTLLLQRGLYEFLQTVPWASTMRMFFNYEAPVHRFTLSLQQPECIFKGSFVKPVVRPADEVAY